MKKTQYNFFIWVFFCTFTELKSICMNFERHQDPLTSMNIGITTWDKLQQGQVLKTKRSVKLTEIPGEHGK
jgi:hypothetical protein